MRTWESQIGYSGRNLTQIRKIDMATHTVPTIFNYTCLAHALFHFSTYTPGGDLCVKTPKKSATEALVHFIDFDAHPKTPEPQSAHSQRLLFLRGSSVSSLKPRLEADTENQGSESIVSGTAKTYSELRELSIANYYESILPPPHPSDSLSFFYV